MRDDYKARLVGLYEERFWGKVARGEAEACWEWQGHRWEKGYGAFKDFSGQLRPAHRVAYEMESGPIPFGHVVMHRCDNPPCVNPAHLRTGTVQENNVDRDSKGRQVASRGAAHGMATTSEEMVRTIRALKASGVKQRDIATMCGVSKHVVSQILTGRTWKHLK